MSCLPGAPTRLAPESFPQPSKRVARLLAGGGGGFGGVIGSSLAHNLPPSPPVLPTIGDSTSTWLSLQWIEM